MLVCFTNHKSKVTQHPVHSRKYAELPHESVSTCNCALYNVSFNLETVLSYILTDGTLYVSHKIVNIYIYILH
jgi:hypothetical protein